MKTRNFIIAIVLSVIPFSLFAQIRGGKAKNNHLYFHVELAAGNIYTAAFPSLLTWGLNELTKSNIFESAVEYADFHGELNEKDLKIRNYNMLGYTANELFNNIHPSIKFGYQTRTLSNFNWGAYATAEYQQNQFKSRYKGDGFTYEKNRLQRAYFGGALFAVIGGVDKKYRFVIEAGCKYAMPLSYEGPLAEDKDGIDKGLVSHFGFKVTGAKAIQDLGIYADFGHYDILKDATSTLKGWNIGLIWTVTPGQRENRVDIY